MRNNYYNTVMIVFQHVRNILEHLTLNMYSSIHPSPIDNTPPAMQLLPCFRGPLRQPFLSQKRASHTSLSLLISSCSEFSANSANTAAAWCVKLRYPNLNPYKQHTAVTIALTPSHITAYITYLAGTRWPQNNSSNIFRWWLNSIVKNNSIFSIRSQLVDCKHVRDHDW